MFGIGDYWAFLAGAVLIILLPGPNSIFVLTTGAREGVGRGYQAAAGVFVGDTVLMVASVGGAAALMARHETLFRAVRYAGALYLAYLGVRMLLGSVAHLRRASGPTDEVPDEVEPAVGGDQELQQARRARSPFIGAIILGLLNPKAILFFIAFFVQFVDPAAPDANRKFFILGASLQAVSMAYLSALILGGSRLASRFSSSPRLAAAGTALVGLVFLGFGASLAFSPVH